MCRKKNLPAPLGAISGNFLHGPEKCKTCVKWAYFPWWHNGPYSPVLGSCAGVLLLETVVPIKKVCESVLQGASMDEEGASSGSGGATASANTGAVQFFPKAGE